MFLVPLFNIQLYKRKKKGKREKVTVTIFFLQNLFRNLLLSLAKKGDSHIIHGPFLSPFSVL